MLEALKSYKSQGRTNFDLVLRYATQLRAEKAMRPYANRLAHLHFLSAINGVPTHMIFLDIINDSDSGAEAVRSKGEWENLTLLVESCLGLSPSKPLMKFVHHVHIDVSTL